MTTFGLTCKNQKIFLVHEWRISEETHHVISRLLQAFSMRSSTSKGGTGKDYLLHYLRSPMKSTFKCLFKDTLLWHVVMSKQLRKPKEQDDHEEGTLSDQPQLTCITPTALWGKWLQQPIEDMMSFRTDFEKHAIWRGYIEEPTGNDFVARKACTIAWSKAPGTNWNIIMCKVRLRNRPEAVVRQATINRNSRVWKSLEESLPEL